jgi:ABC-2 type transport system ATP-binding protein
VAAGARLRETGVTVILTTHYIDEAEEMADRIGVISKGELILVEDKAELMRKLGKKQLTLQLRSRWRAAAGAGRAPLALAPAATSSPTPTTRRRALGIASCCRRSTAPASPSRTCRRAELARGHLRQPGARSKRA